MPEGIAQARYDARHYAHYLDYYGNGSYFIDFCQRRSRYRIDWDPRSPSRADADRG
jgi:hypothetical protein